MSGPWNVGVCIAVTVIFSAAAAACEPSNGAERPSTRTYVGPGYVVDVPLDWTTAESGKAVTFTSFGPPPTSDPVTVDGGLSADQTALTIHPLPREPVTLAERVPGVAVAADGEIEHRPIGTESGEAIRIDMTVDGRPVTVVLFEVAGAPFLMEVRGDASPVDTIIPTLRSEP